MPKDVGAKLSGELMFGVTNCQAIQVLWTVWSFKIDPISPQPCYYLVSSSFLTSAILIVIGIP